MAIYIGNNSLSAAKLGTTNISSIWLGDVKLWPTIVYYKFQAEYSDGTSYNVECNQSTTLSSAETKGNTTSFYDMSACTIGDCVTVIGAEALSETEITSIDIPSSVTEIGQGALSLTHLTALTIPSSVTTVGQGAAEWNNDLSTLNLNEGLVTIGNSAFRWNKNLSSVTIPSTVTSIGNEAFWDDSGLTDVTVYAVNPPTLGTDVFSTNAGGIHVPISCTIHVPCESLDTYKAATNWSTYANQMQAIPNSCAKFYAKYSDNTEYYAECDGNTTLTTATTKPSGYNYTAMTDAVIGYCITDTVNASYAGLGAFNECTSLSSVTIGRNVTSIGEYTFRRCYSLSSITIPNTVTSIRTNAFFGCTALTSFDIPSGVTSIAANTFSGCYSLASINIPNGVTSIGNSSLRDCRSLTSLELPNGLTTIDSTAFRGCYNLESITIPNTVTSIGTNAFYGCTALTSIDFPSGVTSIQNAIFYDCSGITSINLQNSLATSIGNQAFYNCSSLTSLEIPSGVTSIGTSAFSNCKSLTSLEIPSGVTSIANTAFFICEALTSLTFNAITPPTLGGAQALARTNNCPIYVPCESVDAYKAATYWSNYASRIQPIPNSCVSCNWEIMSEGDEIPSNYVKGIRIPFGTIAQEGAYIGFEDEDGNIIEVAYDINDDSWFMQYPSGSEELVFDGDYAEVNFSDYGVGDATVTNSSIPFECILCIVP